MKALIIPVDAGPRVEELETFEKLQEAVGGFVQPINMPDVSEVVGVAITGYINEDGKGMGLPFNAEATKMLAGQLFWGDYIAGPFVICGYDRRKGHNLDVPEPMVQAVMDRFEAMSMPGGVVGGDAIVFTDMDGNPL